MLTNFVTIRKAVKKMAAIDRMKKDGTFETLSKKERLQVDRLRAKLEKNLGSITDMSRLPGALFVVDIKREHIAIKEARKLKIPIFAMVDTNSDPREVEYVIPANDDASKSIEKILTLVSDAVAEGLQQRKQEKEAESKGETQEEAPKAEAPKAEAPKAETAAAEVPAAKEKAPKAKEAPAEKAPAEKTDTEEKASKE